MLSVSESAQMLGVSSARVRALIDSGDLPAWKAGRSWVLREEDVMERVMRRPKPGRPTSAGKCAIEKDSPTSATEDFAGESEGGQSIPRKRRLYLSCKEEFRLRPNLADMKEAQSAEEAAFYMAVADFFLQQRQRELVKRGVY